MKIVALKYYTEGYMTEEFAFGGSASREKLDKNKTYPSSLQNYLIDTGKEVILVDTGLPVETKDFEKRDGQKIYTGRKIADFVQALKNEGYEVEDIDKVIVTHKHPDHTGELRKFNHANIYISEIEADAMKLEGDNIVRVKFENGKYKNFEKSEKIADGITMVPAYGHTKGNSVAIIEDEKLYYMCHGDVTYTDEALRRGELSMIFEDKELAKKTLEEVTEFIKNNKTVYLSTHTPEGVYSLENKVIMEL